MHRVLILSLDDEICLVRLVGWVGVECAWRYSLIGEGQQFEVCRCRILDEFCFTVVFGEYGKGGRHQRGVGASVAQRDALDDESRLRGVIVHIEARHAAFQFDVYGGDVAQDASISTAGHDERRLQWVSGCGRGLHGFGKIPFKGSGKGSLLGDGSCGRICLNGGHRRYCHTTGLVEGGSVCYAVEA